MAIRTIEDITSDMTSLVDGAVDRSLTDEEVTNYTNFETELQTVQRSEGIRTRNAAYNSVVVPAGVARRTAAPQDSLDLAFTNYLRTGIPNQDISGLRVQNAQGEGGSASGGYLVPTGFQQKMVEVRKKFGGFIAEAEQLSTSTGQPLEYPTNDDTANMGDITAESQPVANGADLTFGTVALGAYKYTSAGTGTNLPLRVSVELLQDSAFDVEALVSRKLSMRIARKEAVHAVTGTGVGQPLGIVASSLTSDADLATPDTIVYADLVGLQDLLDEEYYPNAKWLMKKNSWTQIRKIVDTTGRPLIQEQNLGIDGIPKKILLGAEVITDEAMPLNSSAAITYPIAFGDFTESYIWRRVSSIVVVVNPYTRAANGEVEFTAWERADGNIQNRVSYKILRNNT